MKDTNYFSGVLEPETGGVVQIDTELYKRREFKLRFSERILRLAQAEYNKQCGPVQDYERMQERGGLSVIEVVALLADYVERLGGEPSKPRGQK